MFILLIFLASIYYWLRGKMVWAMTLLFLVSTNIMDLKVFSGTILETHNYIFLFTNFVLLSDFAKGKLVADMKEDKFLKLLVYGYLCFLLHCFLTIALRLDSIKYATATLRVDISALLLYFIARKLSMADIKGAFKNICVITVVHCVLYLLQYVGINLFVGENYLNEGTSTLRNGTPAALPLLFLLQLYVFKNYKQAFLFVIPMFGGAARGMLVALATGFAAFYRKLIFKPKYFIIIAVTVVISYTAYNQFLAKDYQRYDVSFTQEIAKAFDPKTLTDYSAYAGSGNNAFSFKDNGTFAFRISMVLERFSYLLHNPQYLPFGVGMVAEESENNNFRFFLGTANEMYRSGYCMIASNDIVWSSVVLRYGLFGIIFWILFFINTKKILTLSDKSVWAQVGYIYWVFFIFNSFGSDAVVRAYSLLPFYLLITYCLKEKKLYASINHNSDV